MRKRSQAILIAIVAVVATTLVGFRADASPSESYSGTHFGAGNLPPGCIADMSLTNPDNHCYHMRTDMNGLDSPQVDVLVLVPAAPTAERDMRIMRQSVEMWEGGIHYMADQMGLSWLADGMDFHVTVDAIDTTNSGTGGEFTTYPIVDPEIVIVATNANPGIVLQGIGIDPIAPNEGPCTGLQNPFDFEAWKQLPGFDNHDGERGGIYNEDCGGAGGNICFAVNNGADPTSGEIDWGLGSFFDLVSHEFGHCLTVGHVGDGLEGDWGPLPSNDIMAYSDDPPGGTKCVSSLDVEGIATTMSKYLDVNGDGVVSPADKLDANDPIGVGDPDDSSVDPFQVQNPRDHFYASGTGSPLDCPQPDLNLVPGPRTQWSPDPIPKKSNLVVTSPKAGDESADGTFNVTGTVAHGTVEDDDGGGPHTSGTYDDADNDAKTPFTEITSLDAAVTPGYIDATMHLAELWPSTQVLSPASYSLTVNDRRFDSFVRYPDDPNPLTFYPECSSYLPAGSSTWDAAAKTVSFHIPLAACESEPNSVTGEVKTASALTGPFRIASLTSVGALANSVADDHAPNGDGVISLKEAKLGGPRVPLGAHATTKTFNWDGPNGNTFYPENSTLGAPEAQVLLTGDDPSHNFGLNVPQSSDVEFNLTWTDAVGGADLDLYVTGAADSAGDGATSTDPSAGPPSEKVALHDVKGSLNVQVVPYLVTDELEGSTYTLTAEITPLTDTPVDTDGDGVVDTDDQCPTTPGVAPTGCPDRDGDGVIDSVDVCPDLAGNGADGCPVAPTERVVVLVDGVRTASQDVETLNGPDSFAIPVHAGSGAHVLKVTWEQDGRPLASKSVSVGKTATDPDPEPTDNGGPAECTGNTGPVVYTDGLEHYASVCADAAPGGLTYVQVDDVPRALNGGGPLVELGVGVDEIDTVLGDNGVGAIYLAGSSPSGPGCNPDQYGPGTDNVVDLGVVRLYTDGLNHYVGVCNESGRVQVDEIAQFFLVKMLTDAAPPSSGPPASPVEFPVP